MVNEDRGFQECLSEVHTAPHPHPHQIVLFIWKKVVFFFFFHAAKTLLFPDCGLNENDFADS